MKVFVIAEKPDLLLDLAGFSKRLGEVAGELETHGFTTAKSVEEAKEKAALGFKRLHVAAAERAFPDQIVEAAYSIVKELQPDLIVGVATKSGNETVARIAGRLNAPMLTEIVEVEKRGDNLVFHRAILGGRAISVEKPSLPAAITIPAKKYEPPEPTTPGEIVEVELPESKLQLVEVKEKSRGAVNVEDAEIVIGVGRGFRKKEDIALAEELARLLNGAVGCSRPIAADYGWLPEDSWIGISGKKIRPKLYMPVGISGAPQHMTAALDAKIIVAVNKDKNAPVFQYADYGVVADLYKFLPVLIEKIKEKLQK